MKTTKIFFAASIVVTVLFFTACDTKKIDASVDKYCTCLKNNNGDKEKCKDVASEISKDFPSDCETTAVTDCEYRVIMEKAQKCFEGKR